MSYYDSLSDLLSAKSYDEIKNVLTRTNSLLKNTNSTVIFDQTNQSSLSDIRNIIKKASEREIYDRAEYLGIVLAVIPIDNHPIGYKIYVDIPGIDVEGIEHPDQFAKDTLDLENIEHKAFYPVDQKVMFTDFPSANDIVRVRISKNYFNTSNNISKDNVYLGIYVTNSILRPNTNRALAPESEKSLKLSAQKRRNLLFTNQPSEAPTIKIGLPFDSSKYKDFIINSFPGLRLYKGVPKLHQGIDFNTPNDTSVLAVCDQEIIYSAPMGTYGNLIIGKSGPYKFYYAHLKSFTVKKGATVTKGQEIGRSNNTGRSDGPHLHFEMLENGKFVSSLFFIEGKVALSPQMIAEYGLPPELTLPLPFEKGKNTIDNIFLDTNEQSNALSSINSKSLKNTPAQPQDKTPTPSQVTNKYNNESTLAASTSATPSSNTATTNSPPTNRPKMFIKNFDVDVATGIRRTSNVGAKTIKVREDMLSSLLKIKEKLNQYNISLTCEDQDIRLENKNISLLAKAGLEIKLNRYAGLSEENNLDIDDYFIGPDYSKPLGNGYKLIVYGNVKRNIKYFDEIYIPEKKIIEVYDPKSLKAFGPPAIKKIFKNVINITKIFEDQGFVDVLPKQEFFLYSDLSKSNWNIFQKPSKIIVGYTYKELLSTVYYNNGESIWNEPDLVWDGSKFI